MLFHYTKTKYVTLFVNAHVRWWSKETVAIVTGGNKGIGFALVKRMAELGLTVILTARDNGRGMKAVESLNKLGLQLYYHQLDVSDISSIKQFTQWFTNNFTALDILVSFLPFFFFNYISSSLAPFVRFHWICYYYIFLLPIYI